MNTAHQKLLLTLENRINLLVIDDDQNFKQMVKNLFVSPLFNVTFVSSFADAEAMIQSKKVIWHCWIMDIPYGAESTGLAFIKKYATFSFVVICSGLQSMTTASQAIECGALKVFDKKREQRGLIFNEICKIATLGYLLQGRYTKYLSHFLLLTESAITDKQLWAHYACLSIRQLERVCSLSSPFTARSFLSFFYTIYYLLTKGIGIPSNKVTTTFKRKDVSAKLDQFCQSHIAFVEKNFVKFYKVLHLADN